ncbi:hypothetical protein TI04_07760 [Achromatium sp. WMS2]|nr:hypothetical protein TI04_07760 [Achromatium sp. WMS2]
MELLDDNTVRFKAPDVLFETGEDGLKAAYEAMLQDFFPRYVAILYAHRQVVKTIRIEGHTSSKWDNATNQPESFEKNFRLSQDRAREILTYSYPVIK